MLKASMKTFARTANTAIVSTAIAGLSLLHASMANAQGFTEYFVPDVEISEPLTQQELRVAFSGKTHRGTYSFLRNDIDTYAFTETTHEDGRILHVQTTSGKAIEDTGQWEIDENRICYDYDDARLRQACFEIYVLGNCYYHYQVEVQGFPTKGFTARSVIKGETANCDPSVS